MSASVPFRPRNMKLSLLTAALQELTPRERRDADPDLAIEHWLDFAHGIGAPNIETWLKSHLVGCGGVVFLSAAALVWSISFLSVIAILKLLGYCIKVDRYPDHRP